MNTTNPEVLTLILAVTMLVSTYVLFYLTPAPKQKRVPVKVRNNKDK